MGGTNIYTPLKSILQTKKSTFHLHSESTDFNPRQEGIEAPRQLFVLTDGEVKDTSKVLLMVRKMSQSPESGCSRLFSFGVGSDASRWLVKGLARAGRGSFAFVGRSSDSQSVSSTVLKACRKAFFTPFISNISVQWDQPNVTLSPSPLQPLFSDDPFVFYAGFPPEFEDTQIKEFTLKGANSAGIPFELKMDSFSIEEITCPQNSGDIHRLWLQSLHEDDPNNKSFVRSFLKYGIVSRHTSLVAIDESKGNAVTGSMKAVDISSALEDQQAEHWSRHSSGGRGFGASREMAYSSSFGQSFSSPVVEDSSQSYVPSPKAQPTIPSGSEGAGFFSSLTSGANNPFSSGSEDRSTSVGYYQERRARESKQVQKRKEKREVSLKKCRILDTRMDEIMDDIEEEDEEENNSARNSSEIPHSGEVFSSSGLFHDNLGDHSLGLDPLSSSHSISGFVPQHFSANYGSNSLQPAQSQPQHQHHQPSFRTFHSPAAPSQLQQQHQQQQDQGELLDLFGSPVVPSGSPSHLSFQPTPLEDVMPAPTTTSTRPLDRIVLMQQANGSWSFLDSLFELLGLDKKQVLSAFAEVWPNQPELSSVCATKLVSLFLEKKFPKLIGEWILVTTKANKFLKTNCTDPMLLNSIERVASSLLS